MYIDFHKFNYDLVPQGNRDNYIKRDQKAYEKILYKWLQENMEQIIQRKWEIQDVLLLEETSDFIKLLKEAETLYELGFYTSCIALVGVSAEDFTKYLSIKVGKSDWVDKKHYKRLQLLLEENVIDQEVFSLLDDIKNIRNGCLHYDQEFKSKGNEELRNESLSVLNHFKEIIGLILGSKNENPSVEVFGEIVNNASEDLSSSNNYVKGFDDMKYRMRNALSQMFGMDMTIKPGVKKIIEESLYVVREIDFAYKEIELFNIYKGLPVFVDLSETDMTLISEINIQERDMVYAIITSEISSVGLSEAWRILKIRKWLVDEE